MTLNLDKLIRCARIERPIGIPQRQNQTPKIGLAVFPRPIEDVGWNQDSASMGTEIDTIDLWITLTRLLAW